MHVCSLHENTTQVSGIFYFELLKPTLCVSINSTCIMTLLLNATEVSGIYVICFGVKGLVVENLKTGRYV